MMNSFRNLVLLFLTMTSLSLGREAPVQSEAGKPRYLMYLTGQAPYVPAPELVAQITHIIIAFQSSSIFNNESTTTYPLWSTIGEIRAQFAPSTKIMMGIGGWSNNEGFEVAARTDETRERWAKGVAKMVETLKVDGVDVDWEYPGGNGEDYKINPNPTKAWQIEAYPLLLSTLRKHLPAPLLISAAVSGSPDDMFAFTPASMPSILSSVDFLNVMTYDLLGRRSTVTDHHTGIKLSLEGIDAYVKAGAPAEKLNLGLAFYVKYVTTDSNGGCEQKPVGCKTVLMEDPITGGDLGNSGGFVYKDGAGLPPDIAKSWVKAQQYGVYDSVGGGHYYWDSESNLFFSWDTEEAIKITFWKAVEPSGVGGVFAWGLGEDSPEWNHFRAANLGMESWSVRKAGGGGRKCGTEAPPPHMLLE